MGKGRSGDEYLGEGEEGLFNLAGLAATPLAPSGDEPRLWGVQSLVRRVVELTADLTSQSAAAGMEERRAVQLERESHRRARWFILCCC